jgi:hypothetical protein
MIWSDKPWLSHVAPGINFWYTVCAYHSQRTLEVVSKIELLLDITLLFLAACCRRGLASCTMGIYLQL